MKVQVFWALNEKKECIVCFRMEFSLKDSDKSDPRAKAFSLIISLEYLEEIKVWLEENFVES
jgi:hypothetical protein